MSTSLTLEINALKVNQWLNEWNEVLFTPKNRKEPQPFFYLFSISATTLKRLSKVYPRKATEQRSTDMGVQRKHDPERSEMIRQYVFGGFPWSDLSQAKKESSDFADLKMPGWLPTAIIANILAPETIRGGEKIKSDDLITISDTKALSIISLPKDTHNKTWEPRVPPIEIIDGQHRLWAFEKDEKLNGNFEVPVVAFYDLDISWQAYLFYIINIKPKKINASLAFDLYPVLRVQDWLERSPDGAFVYRETRAQELVEVLWSMDGSPWKNRINMLGEKYERGKETIMPTITQAAYIRSLVATFIKTTTTKNLGGLYGAPLKDGNLLIWNRTQQAAFLIFAWQVIQNAITESVEGWAKELRAYYKSPQGKPFQDELNGTDPAFSSRFSLIATDQGVRGFLHTINDMVYRESDILDLNSIQTADEIKEDRIDSADVQKAISKFKKSKHLYNYIKDICEDLTHFDWRTASTEGLSTVQRQKQMIYKGSSGYKEIRRELLTVLRASKKQPVSNNALYIFKELGYAE